MSENKKYLFIETFLLGDLLYLGALISALRVQQPDAQIEVLTSSITRGFPFFERLNVKVHNFDFPWSRIGWHLHPVRLVRLLLAFKRHFGKQFCDYIVLDPRGDLRHRVVAYLLRPRKFLRYRSGAAFLDTLRGVLPRHVFVCRQEFAGQIASEFRLTHPLVIPWPWLNDTSRDTLNKARRAIILAPEASVALKYWDAERWKQLANQLHGNGFRTILILHRGDAVTEISPDNFDEVWEGSLSDLGRLVSNSYAVIAVDSFVGHLAAAMNVPVVSLFGTQLPELWKPWGEHTTVVMAPGYKCRPCGQKRCVSPSASCMNAIQIDQVLLALNSVVAN